MRRELRDQVATRRCIGCGKTKPQEDLLRFNRKEPGDVLLVSRQSRGRSAYLCPQARCLENALKRRAFERAFRCKVHPLQAQKLGEMILALLEQKRQKNQEPTKAKGTWVLEQMAKSLQKSCEISEAIHR